MKAYKITISNVPGCSIVCNRTAAQAKAFAAYEFIDTYHEFSFFEAVRRMRCHRVPEYDAWASKQDLPRCVDPIYAKAS
jgi:hypothetical protein